jgi:H+-transporting ATPase
MGPTRLRKRKTNPFLKFLSYFWGPIPWMIEGAVILSGVVRHWPDFFIILLLLGFQRRRRILGGTSGGQCHRRAEAKLAIKAKVKRDGKWTDPPAREVVPGDVIRLRLGDIVPADARLLAATRWRWISPR